MKLFFGTRKETRDFCKKSAVCKLVDCGSDKPKNRRWAAEIQHKRQVKI